MRQVAHSRHIAHSQLRSELASKEPLNESLLLDYVQGCSKRWIPGCVKLSEKLCFVYLLQEGERNFHIIFTQPGPTF